VTVLTGADDRGTFAEEGHIDAVTAHEVSGADFWFRHLLAGLFLFGGATLLGAVYLDLTPHGPHRGFEWLTVAFSGATTLVIIALPRWAIARSSRRLVFFLVWSTFSCVFVGVVAAFDNGLHSPLALLFFLPMTYASLAYPAPAVLGIGALAAACATVGAVAAGDTFGYTEVFLGVIGMVTLLAASVARTRSEQQAAASQLTDRLVELATRDGLTGCLNHRTFYQQVSTELARAVRNGHGVSLLVIDVDDFKSINDTSGHLVGDEVLRSIGSAVTRAGRTIDAAGRIGGDEFAVLLVETTRTQAEGVAARFREAVGELGGPVPVSVTVGVAHLERPTADATPQQLVAEADARLYELKHRSSRITPQTSAQTGLDGRPSSIRPGLEGLASE
jgi:diguanylate cyclase (GGDEF)-like protein